MKIIIKEKKVINTLFVVGMILLILWILGIITSYTMGGGIHVMLALAVIFIVVWLMTGRK